MMDRWVNTAGALSTALALDALDAQGFRRQALPNIPPRTLGRPRQAAALGRFRL
jgi:hypothetical protein